MTKTEIKTRCSSLPLLWNCASSQMPDEGEAVINQSNEPAELGTAFHRWIAAHVAGIDLDIADLSAEHMVSVDELGMMCSLGRRQWEQLRPMMGHEVDWRTEQPMLCLIADEAVEVSITGTADFLSVIRPHGDERPFGVLVILDYKTGRVESDYTHQMRGYAKCALEWYRVPGMSYGFDIGEVVTITAWLRDGVWDVERLSPQQIEDWSQQLLARVRNGIGSFNPGAHCQYCPRQSTCPGRRQLVQATIADLNVKGVNVIPWTAETRAELGPQIGQMYGVVRMVEKQCTDFKQLLKDDIRANGPLPIGDGRALRLVGGTKRSVDCEKALPILRRYASEESWTQAMSISVTKIDKLVAAHARPGKKREQKQLVEQELLEAGAMRVVEISPRIHEGKAKSTNSSKEIHRDDSSAE